MSPDDFPAPGGDAALPIAGYTDIAFLVRGGSSSVYRATATRTGRQVAIKVIDTVEPRRARREIDALRRLAGHPGVVELVESGRLPDGRTYLVTPFCSQGSLATALAARRSFPAHEVIAIGREVAWALAEAHARGILHGDLKPSNVMIDDDGGHRLIDFGTARTVVADLTAGQTISLTVGYSPPEVVDGARADVRSDVYSLGLTLFTLLWGSAPYEDAAESGLSKLVSDITEAPLPDLRQHGVPASLAAVIERATAKDPRDRQQTAEELARDLDALDPVVGPRRGPRGRHRRRRRSVLVTVGVLVLALLAGWALLGRPARTRVGLQGGVPSPAEPVRPTTFQSASQPFHVSGAFAGRRDGYLEISSFVPGHTFGFCLPPPLLGQIPDAPTWCGVRFEGDDHGFTPGARLDPSTSRTYIRIDFRDQRVTVTEHESCQLSLAPQPERCAGAGVPIIENDVPESTRFRPDWESCRDPHLAPLIPIDLPGCLELAGRWYFDDAHLPSPPYANVQELTRHGRRSLRVSWYGPWTADTGMPRAVSDGEIDFDADGGLTVRRDCWPDLAIDWVDRHGVHRVEEGHETNPLPAGYPIELNAARDEHCTAQGSW